MKVTITSGNRSVETDITEEQGIKIGLIKTGWERNTKGDFYAISNQLCIEKHNEEQECYFSDILYRCGNYFASEKLAEKTAKKISLMLRMERWADEHNESIDWNDGKEKWTIHYNTKSCEINTFSWLIEKGLFDVYFSNRRLAEEAADIFGEEILEVMKDE